MIRHVMQMANYNAWANERVYRMAATLSEEQYRREVGAYFKSLHGTLNHLVATDQIWLRRLTGLGEAPTALDAIVCEELPALTAVRQREDARLLHYVQNLTPALLEESLDYHTMNGTPQRQRRRDVLAHIFNHQTHHRGQAHTILTILGLHEPEPLDLLLMQRERS